MQIFTMFEVLQLTFYIQPLCSEKLKFAQHFLLVSQKSTNFAEIWDNTNI